jgi:hypothetical protein
MAIPHKRGRDLAETENEIVGSVFIEIGNNGTGLFGGWSWDWEIAGGTGQVLPARFGGISSNRKKKRRNSTSEGATHARNARRTL